MFHRLLLLLSFGFFTACTSDVKKMPEKTPLELREMQTNMLDTKNSKLVMKSVLNALQDDNFIVKNVAMDLGFLTATKEVDVEPENAEFWGKFQKSENMRWKKYEIIEATVNVCESGDKTRLRVNFQSKLMDNKGAVLNVSQVSDPICYQEFFAKVTKGIL